jgi:hypothetical protein
MTADRTGGLQVQPEPQPVLFPEADHPTVPDYIQAEVFLETLGFFTPSSRRIKHHLTKEKILAERVNPDGTRYVTKTIISANALFGLPITSDLDYYRAFLKICDEIVDRDGRFDLPIAIPTRALIRYAGKVENARERREIRAWIRRMALTGIIGGIYQAKSKDYSDGFVGTLFSQAYVRGERMRNGKIAEMNYIWPAPWWLSNFFYRYLRPFDYSFHRRLRKPIAKALYPILETGWYASAGNPYTKSYHDLCTEFLLAEHRHLSLVKQQLDPAHQELQREHFLADWQYRKAASTTTKHDFIVTYRPGRKFFEDQHARKARQQLAEQLSQTRKQLRTPQRELTGTEETLLEEILTTCGDRDHRAAYVTVIRAHPEGLLWMAISETRQASREHRITKTKGAYFMATVKDLAARWATARSAPGGNRP